MATRPCHTKQHSPAAHKRNLPSTCRPCKRFRYTSIREPRSHDDGQKTICFDSDEETTRAICRHNAPCELISAMEKRQKMEYHLGMTTTRRRGVVHRRARALAFGNIATSPRPRVMVLKNVFAACIFASVFQPLAASEHSIFNPILSPIGLLEQRRRAAGHRFQHRYPV